MSAIINLTEVPMLSSPMDKIEEMQHLQKVPMPGERQVIWAVQSNDDAATRQALPFWVSEPIARRVAIWADQNRVWEDKIDSRMLRGLHLTRVQQENYDRWKQDHQVQTLVFSKRTGSQVIRLKADTDIRTVEGDLFSIKVNMSADPDELTVQAGNGEIQRLVVLRGEASQEAKIPGCLDHGLAPEAFADDFNDDKQQDEVDGQEPDPDQQEQEALEIADKLEESDCGEEIMYYTDEEAALEPAGKHTRVKSFNHRESYLALEKQGVTLLPGGSIHLGYHQTSRTWQGYYAGRSAGLSFTHDGSTNRTEKEALLLVIHGLLKKYCEEHPRDRIWLLQLEKVEKLRVRAIV